jgi:prophage regulatory protein
MKKRKPDRKKQEARALPETGLLRVKEVLSYVPISRSTLWLWVRSGRFPQPIKLSERVTCWRASDIRQLIEGTPPCPHV